jgi:hypothetical protein
MENSMKLIMLGTGNAATVACYNTCFALCREDKYFLVDAGGGNGILSQLQKTHIPLSGIHEIFVTHAHTDHILGVIWMIRMVAQAIQKGEYQGELRIYGHDKVVQVLDWICRMTLPKKIVGQLETGYTSRAVRLWSKRRRNQGHRYLLSDARPGLRGQEPAGAPSFHYMVRLQSRAVWPEGFPGTGRNTMSVTSVEFTGQLHGFQTGLGKGKRTEGL